MNADVSSNWGEAVRSGRKLADQEPRGRADGRPESTACRQNEQQRAARRPACPERFGRFDLARKPGLQRPGGRHPRRRRRAVRERHLRLRRSLGQRLARLLLLGRPGMNFWDNHGLGSLRQRPRRSRQSLTNWCADAVNAASSPAQVKTVGKAWVAMTPNRSTGRTPEVDGLEEPGRGLFDLAGTGLVGACSFHQTGSSSGGGDVNV